MSNRAETRLFFVWSAAWFCAVAVFGCVSPHPIYIEFDGGNLLVAADPPPVLVDGGPIATRDAVAIDARVIVDSGTAKKDSAVDTGVKTAVDAGAGAMWMKCAAGLSGADCSKGSVSHYSYQAALQYCEGANRDGYQDWRLPSIVELETLIDYRKAGPAIDTVAFPSTPAEVFWSSSLDVRIAGNSWSASFDSGVVTTDYQEGERAVRCIRGAFPPGARQVLFNFGERVVTDSATGLMWQGCVAGMMGNSCQNGGAAALTGPEASSYCDGLVWAGYDDWRVPQCDELLTIVNYNAYNPSIDINLFPDTLQDSFWSASGSIRVEGHGWIVNFNYGYVNIDDFIFPYPVRCVRGGG